MTIQNFKFSEYLDNTRFYCGMDVHKHQVTVSVLGKDDTGSEHVAEEIFSMTRDGLAHFWGFVKKYHPISFGMEATNVYHHMVATFLEEKRKEVDWNFSVVIASPLDVAGIPGRQKNDSVDATLLAQYLCAGLIKSGREVIVPLEDMRALFRSAKQVERERTQLKNRIKKNLDRGGVRPVGLELNRHWVRDFLYHLTNHQGTIGEFYDVCFQENGPLNKHAGPIKRNKPKFIPYFDVQLSPGQLALIRQDLVELEFKTARKAMLAVEIDRIIVSRPGLRQKIHNIASIPGLSPYTAAWLVTEVGNATRFPHVKKFLAYCGCCPRVVKSASKVYSSHISRKSNKHIRTMLFHAAKNLCVTTKKESALKTYATKVVARKKHRGMKLAFTIIAAKIARIIFAIMRDNMPFSPDMGKTNKSITNEKPSLLTITDRKLLRRARNVLQRVATIEQLKLVAENAEYFADALDEALKEK